MVVLYIPMYIGSNSDSNSIVMETGIRMRPLMSTLTSFVLVGCHKLKWAMTFEDNLCAGTYCMCRTMM